MANEIDPSENREEGEVSGRVVSQLANNSDLRLRRPGLVGYSQPAAGSIPQSSPRSLANIQKIASIIVALNVTTLRALRDGWYGSPQIINRCCDRYEQFLTEKEVELLDWTMENGGVYFRTRLGDYVENQNRERLLRWLADTRTSDFYSQLVDIEVKKYKAAQAHSVLVLKVENLEIPEAYDYCSSYQSYVEHVVASEQERRTFLRETLARARGLLDAIKVAVYDGDLDDQVLGILKLKALALQEHYRDATAALSEVPCDLFDATRDDWWESKLSQASPDSSKKSQVVAKAYESKPEDVFSLLSNLSFFVPAILLLSCIPTALAWTHSPHEIGKSNDANFYQLIASSLIQLLSLATLLYPTLFHSTFSGYSWLWTWILAELSVVCTLLSLLLYVFLPVAWSMVLGFAGMVAQSLIVLQIVHAI